MNCNDQKSGCNTLAGHLRTICRGERPDLSLTTINAYRTLWKLPPLTADCMPLDDHPSQQATIAPTLLIRGWNFTAAMARWTLAGMPRRTQAEIDERLAICQACPFLQNNHCTKCGCACVEQNRLVNKLALATEKCPEGRWQ